MFRDQLRSALTGSISRVEAQEDTGLRVRLRLSDAPKLAELPWEYLYDGDARRFLALSQWTPLVRYLEMSSPIRPLAVTPPLRILMMAASPTDFPPLDVLSEWTKVRDALADLQRVGRVQLDRVPTGTLADLRAALREGEYHVFHFIGHGRFDPDTKDGVVALEGPRGRAQLVSGADLGALLHDERSLRLALLNSCEGARGGLADPYSGTAQSLVQQGIPAVVAMQFEIHRHGRHHLRAQPVRDRSRRLSARRRHGRGAERRPGRAQPRRMGDSACSISALPTGASSMSHRVSLHLLRHLHLLRYIRHLHRTAGGSCWRAWPPLWWP